MADLHLLSTENLSGLGMRRLTEQLRQAHEAGADLGPRAPHIRAAAPICRNMAQELRRATQEPNLTNPNHKLLDTAAEEILLDLADAIERLANLAAEFPDEHQ
ncbi:hypothetical protein [Methylobacterium sp. 10]|uniref:hypothetical protein n=1 Tax=Methylobacterium sp. 10 TaxID=1101191 RepID=UPI00056D1DB5|nr:hypothetical protein [Methylobacterium sp. 10]